MGVPHDTVIEPTLFGIYAITIYKERYGLTQVIVGSVLKLLVFGMYNLFNSKLGKFSINRVIFVIIFIILLTSF